VAFQTEMIPNFFFFRHHSSKKKRFMSELDEGCPYFGWTWSDSMQIAAAALYEYKKLIPCCGDDDFHPVNHMCPNKQKHVVPYKNNPHVVPKFTEAHIQILLQVLKAAFPDDRPSVFRLGTNPSAMFNDGGLKWEECFILVLHKVAYSADQGSEPFERLEMADISDELGGFLEHYDLPKPALWAGITYDGHYALTKDEPEFKDEHDKKVAEIHKRQEKQEKQDKKRKRGTKRKCRTLIPNPFRIRL